ncbi:phospholipase A2 inhibitor gamma subunit B-like [Ambystoma mexicanum]|uniref:Sodefrin-like factor n=1 Tax=Ambystoma mexicanum TaxID=8296 RepID=A0A125S9L3_AMBME|nr:sodefrin precursor-like factor [Ambystoma mexicanum]AME17859.1 sodefrin precursor-like factor [Ambystoma mexicanum]
MRAFLAVIFSAVLVGVNSLQCEQCAGIGSTCSGTAHTCAPDVRRCIRGLENNALAKGDTILFSYKGCHEALKRKYCSKDLSFRNSVFAMRIGTSCCTTDKCNSDSLAVTAPIDLVPNGLKCPDCFTDKSSQGCVATQEITCTGNHNMCGSFNGTAARAGESAKPHSFRGCISKDACDVGLPSFAGSHASSYDLKCTPALRPQTRPALLNTLSQ